MRIQCTCRVCEKPFSAYPSKVRVRVRAIKLQRGCADCGYRAHADALEFDHLPGYVKVAGVSFLVSKRNWAVVEAEIAKCEVVCANCHRIRTAARKREMFKETGDGS